MDFVLAAIFGISVLVLLLGCLIEAQEERDAEEEREYEDWDDD
jgi:hypothetical protein